ncbi:Transducin (beta)-like 1 X-linked receptor 1, partial [Nowakowskiella sp. JEL0078]
MKRGGKVKTTKRSAGGCGILDRVKEVAMSVNSDDVNYLIYRYLTESGFSHSSFTFSHEANLSKNSERGAKVKPGALINLLQKGLQYIEVETHVRLDGSEMGLNCTATFSIIGTHICDYREDKRQKDKEMLKEKEFDVGLKKRGRKRVRRDSEVAPLAATAPGKEDDTVPMSVDTAHTTNGTVSKDEELESQTKVLNENISVLNGHTAEAYVCCWNPVFPLLATGSGDGTAKIWTIPFSGASEVKIPITLVHESTTSENRDVMTIEWNPSGTLLATGSFDGFARIWTKEGNLQFKMSQHTGPIFALKWNNTGELLLSGSVDSTAIVWDAQTGEVRQQFKHHQASTLDVDWYDAETFATCSSDKHILVCRLGCEEPLHKWEGHTIDVNAIKWDPSHNLLASCSDDKTLRIWSISDDIEGKDPCKWVLKGHEQEIYTLRWSPVDGKNADEKLIATASFDSTVRIWDVIQGVVRHTLKLHTDSVYTISFSPNGKYLASGSFDNTVNIWDTRV